MEEGKFGGRGICKMFGQKSVLSGADLELPIGGVAGIFGLNGAGKTTLLRILAGLDDDFSGELYKTDFADVAYTASDENFPLGMTVRGAVEFFERFGGGKVRKGEIFDALGEAGITAKQALHAMSLGMRQYFRFLLAVYGGASVCLLDEPFTNLDVNLRANLSRTLIRECGPERLFVITTHEIKEVENLIDGFFILRGGRLSAYLSCEEVRERGESIEDYYRSRVNV